MRARVKRRRFGRFLPRNEGQLRVNCDEAANPARRQAHIEGALHTTSRLRERSGGLLGRHGASWMQTCSQGTARGPVKLALAKEDRFESLANPRLGCQIPVIGRFWQLSRVVGAARLLRRLDQLIISGRQPRCWFC
jgi:hypothetical protein